METHPKQKDTRRQLITFLWNLLPTVLFLAIIIIFIPFRFEFQYNPDEGVNLMKATSIANGHRLYEEVWSDQPPVLSWLLAGIIHIFGNSIAAARLLILCFSGLLFWAQFQILENLYSYRHAVLGGFLLLILPEYWHLSVSVMVGLPSIAMATFSVYSILQWQEHRRYAWLFLSGLTLGIAISIKLFTGILIPILMTGLWLNEFNQPQRPFKWIKVFVPALRWGLVVFIFLASIVIFGVGLDNLDQLIGGHLEARTVEVFDSPDYSLSSQFQPTIPFLILGLAGFLYSLQKEKWFMAYPLTWSLLAIILLMDHRPFWSHQTLLFSVPAVMLGAPPLGEIWDYCAKRSKEIRMYIANNFLLLLSAICFVFIWVSADAPLFFNNIRLANISRFQPLQINNTDYRLLNEIGNHAANTNWIIADYGMYAFYHHLQVPPELAALTTKRIETGGITETRFIEIVDAYQPEQILLSRNNYPELIQHLGADYCLVLEINQRHYYFLRNDFVSPCTTEVLTIKENDR